MTVVRLWAIVGGPGVGKSTTIGHLAGDFGKGKTGLRRGRGGGIREILLRGGGYLSIHPKRQSLQEAGKTPDQAFKEINRQSGSVQNANPQIQSAYFNALLAIRTDNVGSLPTGERYLSYFVGKGWQIQSLVLLASNSRDEQLYRRFGAPVCYIYDSTDIDIVQLIGQVRNHFGWA